MPNEKGAMKPKGKLLPIYKRLFRYVLAYKKLMLLITSGLVISSVLSLAPAWIVKTALDKYLAQGMSGYLIASGIAIIAAAFFQALIDFETRYYSEVNGQKVIYTIRRDVYSHLMDLPFTYYDHARTGDTLSRVTSDAEALQTFLGFASVNIISNLLYILGVFIVMLIWNIKLSLLYLLFVPFIVFGISKYAFRLRPANMKLRKIMGRMSGVMREQLRGMQVIKTFGRENHAVESCDKESKKYMAVGFETGRITSFWMPYAVVFIGISTGAILWYGGSKVIAGSISIGMLSGFLTYITMMVRPLQQTGMLTSQIITAAAAAERIFEVLDIGREVEDSPNATELKIINGLVEYKDVSFS